MPRHYHVLQGMPGYMPDVNHYCRTKYVAESVAHGLAADWRDDGDTDEKGRWQSDYTVSGNQRTGYHIQDKRSNSRTFYIEIARCDEEDCSTDDDS